jgi:basic membrane protein A
MRARLHTRLHTVLAAALAVALLSFAVACGGDDDNDAAGTTTVATTTDGTTTGADGEETLAALVSDIGRFTDRGFNQNQLDGLNRARDELGVRTLPLASSSASDYVPNLTTAVRRDSDIVIAAGFLLADATAAMAERFPDTHFAITDYSVTIPPFADDTGAVTHENVQGLTYAANEAGCLVGVLAAKTAERTGTNVISAVGGLKIPPVDIWIAGYRFCAERAVPGTRVLVGYSQDFVATDKCRTVAQNQINRGSQVLFQVAGGCGLGTLRAADAANRWGIGVDVDQYELGERVLTSGVKRVDNGVFEAIRQAQEGNFQGGTDLVFDLENDGVGVGKINPEVPQEDIDLMEEYRQQIIDGELEVPTSL